jgi:porphobilinogen synthase
MFPLHRGRRLRVNESIRSVRETTLSPSDFMFPMFIAEGENVQVEIHPCQEFSPFYRFNG